MLTISHCWYEPDVATTSLRSRRSAANREGIRCSLRSARGHASDFRLGLLQLREALPFLSGLFGSPDPLQSTGQLVVRAGIGGLQLDRTLQRSDGGFDVASEQQTPCRDRKPRPRLWDQVQSPASVGTVRLLTLRSRAGSVQAGREPADCRASGRVLSGIRRSPPDCVRGWRKRIPDGNDRAEWRGRFSTPTETALWLAECDSYFGMRVPVRRAPVHEKAEA